MRIAATCGRGLPGTTPISRLTSRGNSGAGARARGLGASGPWPPTARRCRSGAAESSGAPSLTGAAEPTGARVLSSGRRSVLPPRPTVRPWSAHRDRAGGASTGDKGANAARQWIVAEAPTGAVDRVGTSRSPILILERTSRAGEGRVKLRLAACRHIDKKGDTVPPITRRRQGGAFAAYTGRSSGSRFVRHRLRHHVPVRRRS